MDCYRLAKYYGRDPDEFMSKPISAIRRHLKYTAKLIEETRADDDGDS